MTLEKKLENGILYIKVAGRIDSNTARELEKEIDASIDGATGAEMDMSELTYISSAGLRVLLGMRKKLNDNKNLVLRNVADSVKEVLEITGFDGILTIE